MLIFDGDDDDEELDLGDVELEDDDTEEDTDDTEEDADEEDDSDEDDGEDEEPAPKSKRANERIRALAKARKDTEAENIRLKQQLDSLRGSNNAQQAPQDNQAARQAYLASLPADQRAQAELHLSMQEHRLMMQQQQFQMADSADKAQYDAIAITNPLYRRYAAKVEQKLQELRRTQNITAPRSEVLKHLVGEIVVNTKGKAVSKKNAKASVDKNKVKPSSGKKADLNGGDRRGKTARDRLEGVKF